MRKFPASALYALALLVMVLLAVLQLLRGPHPSWTGWVLAGTILLGAWFGWAFRQVWIYPSLLSRAEALWAEGAPASQVAKCLSRASLATGELGYRIHLLRAMAHLSLGYQDRAWLDSLQAQLARLPTWKRLLVGRAFGKVPESPSVRRLAWGERLIRLAPRMARLRHLQGILWLRSGSPEAMHAAWRQFEAALPLAWDDLLVLEDLLLAGLQHGQEHLAEAALAVLTTRHGDPRLPWDRGAVGLFLLQNERYIEALALVQRLPPERRTQPLLWLCESVARRQLGDREGAWRVAEAAVQQLPEAFRLWMERYQIALDLHRDGEALASLDRAWQTIPSDPNSDSLRQEWRLRRAEFALWWEDLPDFAQELLAAVPRDQQGGHQPPLRLQILVAQGDYETAYQEVVTLLEQEPEDVDLLLLQADCLAGMEAWEALLPYLNGLSEGCRERASFWHLRGLAQANLGEPTPARLDLERSVRMDPRSLRYLLDAGHGCAELGDWDRAEGHWRQALQIDAQAEEALIHLAEARQGLDDLEGARRYLRECLLHHPDSQHAQAHLAELEAN